MRYFQSLPLSKGFDLLVVFLPELSLLIRASCKAVGCGKEAGYVGGNTHKRIQITNRGKLKALKREIAGDTPSALLGRQTAVQEKMTATTELPPEITVIPQAYLLIGVSVGVIFLCLSFLLWRQSSSSKGSKVSAQLTPKLVIEETPLEEVEDDGTKKVTILFGTQTGTAEGFAKVSVLYTNSYYLMRVGLFPFLTRSNLPS